VTLGLGLQGRRAVIHPARGPLAACCAAALRAEGVDVGEPDAAETADLIVAIAPFSARGERDDLLTTERLNAVWNDAVVDVVSLFQRALPHMKAQRHGRLVVVAPAAARTVVAGADLDSIVALGLLGLQKSLSGELGPYEITANSVLWEGEAIATSQDGLMEGVADAVAYLCSEPAAFLTGTTITVDRARNPGMF